MRHLPFGWIVGRTAEWIGLNLNLTRVMRERESECGKRARAEAEVIRLRDALALARGDGFTRSTGRYVNLTEQPIAAYTETRRGGLGKMLEIECSLECMAEPTDLARLQVDGRCDFRGLEWRVVRVEMTREVNTIYSWKTSRPVDVAVGIATISLTLIAYAKPSENP